jgi:hypothetical protein
LHLYNSKKEARDILNFILWLTLFHDEMSCIMSYYLLFLHSPINDRIIYVYICNNRVTMMSIGIFVETIRCNQSKHAH